MSEKSFIQHDGKNEKLRKENENENEQLKKKKKN